MPRLVQLRRTCDQGMDCPTLHYQCDSDKFVIQGYAVTDPQVLAELNLHAGQTSTSGPSGPLGSGGTECTSSTPPTGWGAICVTNANGDTPRPPPRERASASSICPSHAVPQS